jgi:ribosome-associated protein
VVSPATLSALRVAARAAEEKLAENLVALDVSEPFALAEVFLIASGNNERQTQAIGDEIERKLLESGVKLRVREGRESGRWVLLDFGDLVVHVMHADEREFYSLERLWRDCPVVPIVAS